MRKELLDANIAGTDLQTRNAELQEKQMQIETMQREQDEAKGLKKDYEEALHEITTLRHNHANLTKTHQKLVQKSEEVNLEFINLVNAKAALANAVKGKEAEIARLMEHNEYLQRRLEGRERDGFETNAETQRLRKDLEDARSKLYETEQRLIAESKAKTDLESSLRKEAGRAEERLKLRLKSLEDEKRAGEDKTRNAQRQQRVMEERVEALREELDMERNRGKEIEEKLEGVFDEYDTLVHSYRSKLEKFIKDVAAAPETIKHGRTSGSEVKTLVKQMFEEILQSYITNEQRLLDKVRLHKDGKRESGRNENVATDMSVQKLELDLKEFMKTSQQKLEKERSQLLTRCLIAEQQVDMYQKRLRK
ncbi:hypothetical protein HDV00_001072 [Rhizophlyctis rosea]|nr:hypothetical protein HDV00_001072 [Rhizophlyctis rosea]